VRGEANRARAPQQRRRQSVKGIRRRVRHQGAVLARQALKGGAASRVPHGQTVTLGL